MRGIALLLLFTHQSWAGIMFICADGDESQHACCHTGRRLEYAAEAPVMNDLPQKTETCCNLSPQAEAQTFSITTPIFIPADNRLEAFGISVSTSLTPGDTGDLQPS